jgi:hypothetical protein
MFHQDNGRAYDGTHSLISDVLDRALEKYGRLVTPPLLSPSMDGVAQDMSAHMQYQAGRQGLSASVVTSAGGSTLQLSATQAVTVPITGLHVTGIEVYAGEPIVWVAIGANGTVNLPISSTATMTPTPVGTPSPTPGPPTSTPTPTFTVTPTPTPTNGVPAAVIGVSARALKGSNELSWASAGASVTYSIYRATQAGGQKTLLASGLTTSTYTDSLGLIKNQWYYYQVTATNRYGEGPASAEVAVHAK